MHRKIDIKDLVDMESKIVLALDFKTITTTFYDYILALVYSTHVQKGNSQNNTPSPLKIQNNLVRSIQMYNSTPKTYKNNQI